MSYHARDAMLLLFGSVLPLALAAAEPVGTLATDDTTLCDALRAERRVSYKGQEPKLFRRIVELVERRPASPPAAATVLRTFAACAERFRAAGDAPLPVRIRFDASSSETSIVVTAIDGRPRIFRFRGELPGFAERVTKHIERGSAESQRDEMRNRIWFLWIESYLRATGEKYDGYDYASDLADERAEDRGLSFGVGFDVSVRQDRVEVQRIDDLRLREAGLVEGDEIVAIDDRAVSGLSVPELRRYWTSRTPFRVSISIRRNGQEIRVACDAVPRRHRTIAWSARGRTGYVRLRAFNAGSLTELRRALRALDGQGVDRLILDVRRNPGGILSPGLVDVFFKPGQTILSCREYDADHATDEDATVEYRATPTAVLVDRESASMAETLAAAFRVHRRGPIVGETTFGKSVGQTLYDVLDEGRLHLVTRTCYYPGTRDSWDGKGIAPDVEVVLDDDARARLVPFLDHEPLRLDEQWIVDPVVQAAERRLEEEP